MFRMSKNFVVRRDLEKPMKIHGIFSSSNASIQSEVENRKQTCKLNINNTDSRSLMHALSPSQSCDATRVILCRSTG